MADISITLTLDDKDYQANLKRVDTNTLNVGNNIKKSMADATESIRKTTSAFDDFGKTIEKTNSSLTSLATAIIGASLTSFIKSAMEGASSTERMAEALGVTTAKYMELSQGALAAGKDVDAMGRMMLRMEATAQQANDGNLRLRESYAQLGISMDYMKTHSPDQVMLAVAEALTHVESNGKRAELVMALLGRDAKTFDFEAFVKGARAAAGGQDEFAQANANAARAYREFNAGIQTLKNNLLELLEPIMKLIGDNAHGFLGAKNVAEAFLAVLTAATIKIAIGTIDTLYKAVGSLGAAFFGSAVASATETRAVEGNTAALLRNTELRAAGLTARAVELRAIIAEAEATLASNAEAARGTAASLELSIARRTLTNATVSLTAANVSLAETQAIITGASATTAATAVTTTGAFAGLRAVLASLLAPVAAVVGFFTAPAWAIIAAGLAAMVAAVGGLIIVWKAFGTEISNFVSSSLSVLAGWAKGAWNYIDSATTRIAERIRQTFGMTRFPDVAGGGRGGQGGATAEQANENLGKPSTTPLLTGTEKNPFLEQANALREQFKLLQFNNVMAEARLRLETSLASASADTAKSTLAEFDAGKTAGAEYLRISGEIRTLEIGRANSVEPEKYTARINILRQELEILKQHTNVIGQETLALQVALQAVKEKRLMSEEDLKIQKDIIGIQTQISELGMTANEKSIADIRKRRDEETAALIEKLELLRREKLTADEISDIYAGMASKYAPVIAKQQELNASSRSFDTGFTSAWKNYVDGATNAAQQAKDSFEAVTKNMDSALTNFVKTGKLNFGDLARSIIADLAVVQLKAAFGNVMGAAGAATGFTFTGLLSSIGNFFGGKASGGDIPGGGFALVGERGPELVSGPATVTNARDTAGMMGGTTVHNYNIQAVDAKSVAQLFYENRMTMYGMTEQARRELPMRTR
jgi:hypothetical protein